jgi:hypothetical protein
MPIRSAACSVSAAESDIMRGDPISCGPPLHRIARMSFRLVPALSIPLAPILLGSQLMIAVADGVPTVDIQNTCKAAANVTAGTSVQQDIDICTSSEQKARETMVKDWSSYPEADRTRCVQAGRKVYLPSYVEWLTCLEMEAAVRKMRAEDKTNQRQR